MNTSQRKGEIVFIVDERGLALNARVINSLGSRHVNVRETTDFAIGDDDLVAVDVDLSDIANVRRLRAGLGRQKHPTFQAFAVNHSRRLEMVHANILGATAIFQRPFALDHLVDRVEWYLMRRREAAAVQSDEDSAGIPSVTAAAGALNQMFDAIVSQNAFDAGHVTTAGAEVVDAIAELGFADWVAKVRRHHESTFQHCLIVTGVATAFGRGTGMSQSDVLTLTTAGLVHDIGKAAIPVAILDKPDALSEDEFEMIKRHPGLGYQYLIAHKALNGDILDAVRHHHEYLDGSGYPDRLSGNNIGDVTRILTVCDIYGALIERRSYKVPKSQSEAFAILDDMAAAGKLETCLVKALQTSIVRWPESS